MTITTKSSRPSRSDSRAPLQRHLIAVRVLEEVYRVDDAHGTVGYVEKAGFVYVSLKGPVYNTSVEIAQCLDLDDAIQRLRAVT